MTTLLMEFKQFHRPDEKKFEGKPHERKDVKRRGRTRPWDNVWFSNRPEIIMLTVEEAIQQHLSYMLWCYANLNIKWSVHTVKLFDKVKPANFEFKFSTNYYD